MKYVLLFGARGADISRYAAMTEEERHAQEHAVGEWFGRYGSRVTGGKRLGDPSTATTVSFDGDSAPLVTDGPFLEANEVIGGYAEIEVADLDEALAMARTWPPRGAVEIRPVLDM